MENNELFTGVVDDPRDDPKVQNGYSINEVLAFSAVVNWVKKTAAEVVQYAVWNQYTSSACVAFAKAKQISIKVFELTGVWIDFSPASIYQPRLNSPELGMNISDANTIVDKRGVTLEALMKSQGLSEAQIMAVKRTKVADLFAKAIAEAVGRYLYVPVDIDRIAQTIESKKAVSLLIFATADEYSRAVPVVLNPNLTYANAAIRHEVVAVDYFLGNNGDKRLFINDSAHFGGFAVREFTEEFLLKRCVLADALDVFTFDPDAPEADKPHYTFTKTMAYGDSNADVVALQDILRYEGFFPSNQSSTGYYGSLTATGVLAWQKKHQIASTAELDSLKGRLCGNKTIQGLNQNYGQ